MPKILYARQRRSEYCYTKVSTGCLRWIQLFERVCNQQYYKRDTGQDQNSLVERLNVCRDRIAVEMEIVEMYCGRLGIIILF